VRQLHHSELLTGGRENHAHLTGADSTIDTILDLNRETLFLWGRGADAHTVFWISWFAMVWRPCGKNSTGRSSGIAALARADSAMGPAAMRRSPKVVMYPKSGMGAR